MKQECTKKLAAWFVVLSVFPVPGELMGQLCEPANITLSEQAQVDRFQQDYGPCDRVGSLEISGPDIANLDGLEGLTRSNGNLLITHNPDLRNLSGLESLVEVFGDFNLTDNTGLLSTEGMTGLEYVGRRFRIERNDSLEDLSGLTSLRQVQSFFYIQGNAALTSLKGLSAFEETLTLNIKSNASLETVEGMDSLIGSSTFGLRIFSNPKLGTLKGLENVSRLRELFIQDGSLKNLEGLSGLRELGQLYIQLAQTMTSLDGLDSIEGIGDISIVSNPELVSLDALLPVTSLAKITVRGNPLLANLDGLFSVVEVAGDITVRENPNLYKCEALTTALDKIDHAEEGPGVPGMPDVGGDVLIGENASGCNAILQILEPGSEIFVINPALTDAWFNPDHNGQGYFINLFPDIESVFVGWFTFETADRQPYEAMATVGEPYHRWLTAFGSWVGTKVTLDVALTTSGIFDNPEPVENSPPNSYGTMTIIFHSCDSATLSFDLYGIESGSTSIVRVAPDRVGKCVELSAYY